MAPSPRVSISLPLFRTAKSLAKVDFGLDASPWGKGHCFEFQDLSLRRGGVQAQGLEPRVEGIGFEDSSLL